MKNITSKSYKKAQIKEIVIFRGCPSSGKSFLANELAGEAGSVLSADDYHTDPKTGKYNWKPQNVKAAHQWNHQRVKDAIEQGISPVIIDNTNTTMWELKQLKPLVTKAQALGYDVRIEEPNPDWYHWDTAFDADALFERNKGTHNVPLKSIQKMIDRWDKNVTVEDILGKRVK